MQKNSAKAFTLIELLIVVATIAIFILLVICGRAQSAGTEARSGNGSYRVRTKGLEIELSSRGEIVNVSLGARKAARRISGGTSLTGCETRRVNAKPLAERGMEFTKEQTGVTTGSAQGRHVTLIERFRPTPDSIRWEIEIHGDGAPWSVPIETRLVWPDPASAKTWTSWGDSRPGDGPGFEGASRLTGWEDPLVPKPFQALDLSYGTLGEDNGVERRAISIPLVTVLDAREDVGLTLALSPEDLILSMRLRITPSGEMVFARSNYRLGGGRIFRFAMDLTTHPADWRSGLGWMVARYPEYFNPPNPRAHEIAGCGAYTAYFGDLDAAKMLKMGFRVNWKASFDYPYMGMFLPPVGDDEPWIDDKNTTATIRKMRDYSHRMRQSGFHVLNYFNVTELGKDVVKGEVPPRRAKNDKDLWRNSNDYVYHTGISDAILYYDGKPAGAWEGGIAMDPGIPSYQKRLLEQARRHIERLPDSDGICIDRMDYARIYDWHRDDGVSWLEGNKPARSLVISWQDTMSKLGAVMHGADKVIFSNPLYRRFDLFRHLDGLYDEAGQRGSNMNMDALAAVRKPAIMWTYVIADPDPDSYFQRHLYMGAYVTAPVPENDHTIRPSGMKVDRYFLDYGPLMDTLRGREWVLQPHVIEVPDEQAKVNLFSVPGGYLVPVMFGGSAKSARIILHNLPRLPGQQGFRIQALHPGQETWAPVKATDQERSLLIDVPLVRGCAMLRLAHTWLTPTNPLVLESVTLEMGTTIPGANIRYTLDDRAVRADSPLYEKPITLSKTTPVRMAVFKGDHRLGAPIATEFVKAPSPAPWITPGGGIVSGSVMVEMTPVMSLPSAQIHYTLDGAEPNAQSPVYTKPFTLDRAATVKARTWIERCAPGATAEATFTLIPPLPPAPEVSISDLKPLKATIGWGDAAQVNLSIGKQPLTLGGRVYPTGMGVSPPSELVYEIKPEYRRFVAVVGIDDAMRQYTTPSMTFKVFAVKSDAEQALAALADEAPLCETPILRAGEYWPIDVKLPAGTHSIRLVATDGGDGPDCDHGDWVATGFRKD
jgi:hypothetical protein